MVCLLMCLRPPPRPLPSELGNVVLAIWKAQTKLFISQGVRWECTEEPCHMPSVTPMLSVHLQARRALPRTAAPGGPGGEDESPAPDTVPGPALGDSGAAQVSECSLGDKWPMPENTVNGAREQRESPELAKSSGREPSLSFLSLWAPKCRTRNCW